MHIAFDVGIALAEVPVNIGSLISDFDFKTRMTAIAYNASGLSLKWNFVDTHGNFTQTAVTPTNGGSYPWAHQGDGIYTIGIPASGGASINNNAAGVGWFTGIASGVLSWVGPMIVLRAANVNNSLVNGTESLHVDISTLPTTTQLNSAVAPLATTAQLNSAVAPLATASGVASAVAPLATASGLASAVAPLATSAGVTSAVANLATTTQLNSAVAPLATAAGLSAISSSLTTLLNTVAALNDVTVAEILTTQMTESYAANGAAPTLAQALFAIHQHLMSFSFVGTSRTVKKLNGTPAFIETLDDATNPTGLTR